MKIHLFILALLLLLSCNQNTEPPVVDFAETKKFTESQTDRISYAKTRNRDIVVHLFQEAMEADPNLKILDQKIKKIEVSTTDSLAVYNEYMSYNEMYYSSAFNHVNMIMDSSKRKAALAFLNKSNLDFKNSTTSHKEAEKTINELTYDMLDQHQLMKIIITEQLINVYQEKLPATAPLESINTQLEQLIKESEEYTKN